MAAQVTYTQIGGVTVSAYQMVSGATLSSLPTFLQQVFCHIESNILCVSMPQGGTESCPIGSWVVKHADGTFAIMSNAAFTALYH